MIEPKFDVNDVLKPIMDDTNKIRLHVVEVTMQKCPANINQVRYLCRMWSSRFKGDAPGISPGLISFNEIEVEKFVDPEKQPSASTT